MATKTTTNLILVSTAAALVATALLSRARRQKCSSCAYESLIGETPMVRLPNLSRILQRDIYLKMESMNPGGTGKDRAALSMIQAAEESGALPTPGSSPQQYKSVLEDPMDQVIKEAMKRSRSGGLVVEGTSGSTGIALTTLCTSRGHACLVVMPDDQAQEKQQILKTLGAVVHVVPNVAISNPNHYVNIARRLAERARMVWQARAIFTDQFENEANFRVHFEKTGPEIARQCPQLDAFVMSSGTGGTIAGVGRYLKQRLFAKRCRVVLVDPPGSALYNKIEHGVAYASQQREREMKRHRYDTLAEGIGLDRVTHNFALGCDYIDEAILVTDQEAVDMAHWILHKEGIWVGSSSSMNIVGATRTALQLRPGSTVVAVGCDSGTRHLTRFWNRDFCIDWGLKWPEDAKRIPECLKGTFK